MNASKLLRLLLATGFLLNFAALHAADSLDSWTQTFSRSSGALNGATYGAGLYIAVGEAFGVSDNALRTSPDGTSWATRSVDPELMYSVTYAGGKFVAVAEDGAIFNSPDGVSWTSFFGPVIQDLRGVAWNGSLYVAVGASRTIITSPDGVNWTARNAPAGRNVHFFSVAYGNGVFVAVGLDNDAPDDGGAIVTSPDGITWTDRSLGGGTRFFGVTFHNGTFVAVGRLGEIYTSGNGLSWTSRSAGTFASLNAVVGAAGRFLAVGAGGTILSSDNNGVSWTARSSGVTNDLFTVAAGPTNFIAAGFKQVILRSGSTARFIELLGGNTCVFENRGFVEVTVLRSGDTHGTVSFTMSTGQGTAVAGQDYTPRSLAYTLGTGATAATFIVTLLNGTLEEGPKTLPIYISAPSGASVIGSPTNWVTILDDDRLGMVWNRNFGAANRDFASGLHLTASGADFAVGASSESIPGGTKSAPAYGAHDFWLLRVSGSGNLIGDVSFGGSGQDMLNALDLANGDGSILVGSSSSPISGNKTAPLLGGNDAWVVRVDNSGGPVWDRSFGGTNFDTFYGVRRTIFSRNGHVHVCAGESQSPPSGNKSSPSFGSSDGWLVKLDDDGNTLWEQSYGGQDTDVFLSVDEVSAGGFIAGGYSSSEPSGNKTSLHYGGADFWFVRVDTNGVKLWERTFGGSGDDNLTVVRRTSDGGFIAGGLSSSPPGGNKASPSYGRRDVWLVRLDANGNKLWEKSFGGSEDDYLTSLQETFDHGFILGAISYSGLTGNKSAPPFRCDTETGDAWILRLDADGNKLYDRTFGGSDNDLLGGVVQITNGGIAFVCTSFSTDGVHTNLNYGSADLWLVRLATDPVGTNRWDYLQHGRWEESDKWSLRNAPNRLQAAVIIENTNFPAKTIVLDNATALNHPETMTVSNLLVTCGQGSIHGFLSMSNTVPLRILNALTVQSNGFIAGDHPSLLVHGPVTINSPIFLGAPGLGGILIATNQSIQIGTLVSPNQEPATLQAGNGLVHTRAMTIGVGPVGKGSLGLAGGTNRVIDLLTVGNNFGTGVVNVVQGLVDAPNFDLGINAGSGQVNLVNGRARTSLLRLGFFGGAGVWNQTGGLLEASTFLLTGGFQPGSAMAHVGGGEFTFGFGQIHNSSSLTVSNAFASGGDLGVGTINNSAAQVLLASAGTLVLTNTLTIGNNLPSSVGTGTVCVADGLLIVTNQNRTGTIDLRNGSLVLKSGAVIADRLLNTGTIVASNGATIRFQYAVTNNGTLLAVNGGRFEFLGPLVNRATINVTNGSMQFFGSFSNSGTILLDPAGDADADGASNRDESLAGTAQFNPASALRLLRAVRIGQDVRVDWTSVGGHSYVVQRATNVTDNGTTSFLDVSGLITVAGTREATTNYIHLGGGINGTGFYRIRLVPCQPGPEALDQQQPSANAGAGSTDQWQSFTAGQSGLLTKVELWVGSPTSPSASPGIIRIYAGEGTNGALLATQSVTFTDPARFQTFALSSPPHVAAGSQYTIRFNVPSVSIGWLWLSTANPYSGGRGSVDPSWDYVFKTYVAPACD